MELIPVLDLAHGVAVQARAGDRSRYGPVESVLTPGRVGDPFALLQAYRDTLGARECYVADLDAIQGGEMQREALGELARVAAPCRLMVDAGISDVGRALEVLSGGAGCVVVGLETLRSFEDLARIVHAADGSRVAFSLDLRLGVPMFHPLYKGRGGAKPEPGELAARAVEEGATRVLVLDVGRVGTSGGVDQELLVEIRAREPTVRLLAGGGVRGAEDLDRLEKSGCDGALVATALHTGALRARPLGPQSSANTSR